MDFPYFNRPRAFGSTTPFPIPIVTKTSHQPSKGPFVKFPEKLGYKPNAGRSESLDIDSHSADEITVLLQSWLFFGLLAEFLGTDISVQAFILEHDEAEGQTLNHTALENRLVEWHDRIQHMPKWAVVQRKESIWQCLNIAVYQSELFDHTSLDVSPSHFAAVSLSVKLLILVLYSVAQSTFCDSGRSSLVQSSHIRRLCLTRAKPGQRPRLDWLAKPFEHRTFSLPLPLPPGIEFETASPAAKLLIDSMLEAGWCSHVIRKLCRSYDYTIINYLALLRRGTDPAISHENCNGAPQCIANNVSLDGNASYQTRHVVPECQCSFLKVDTAELVCIIRSGNIPLVLVTQGTNGFRLRLVRRQPRTSYVAFSHVWSDGMGNPVANSLPECQISRLWNHVRRVRAVGDTVGGPTSWSLLYSPQELIWIDTLCIPVGPSEDMMIREVKLRAINHMAPIYAEADNVYVLDAELQQVNVYRGTCGLATGEVSATEVSGILLCSAWMGRTWTLQEAVLSHDCRYILANCSYGLESRWKFLRGQLTWPTKLRLFIDRHFIKVRYNPDSYDTVPLLPWLDPVYQSDRPKRVSPLARARVEFDRLLCAHTAQALNIDIADLAVATSKSRDIRSSSWRAMQFARTWNSLLDRSTTKPEDQHGIFATLLDFNAYKVRSLDARKRMPTIIRSCDELPLSLLFNNGPRLPSSEPPENSWIPSAIGGDRLTPTPVLVQTSLGFVLLAESHNTQQSYESLYVFMLGSDVPFAQQFCLLDTRSGMEYFLQVRQPPQDKSAVANHNLDERLHAVLQTEQKTCIIFDKQIGTSSPKGFLAAGAWFSISRIDSNNIFVTYICPLLVHTRESLERTQEGCAVPVHIRSERCQTWQQVILQYDPQACGDRLLRRPPPPDNWTWSIETFAFAVWFISLGCAAMIVTLAAKTQLKSGHSYMALVFALSIPLTLLSTWLAGYVNLLCHRAQNEAWIATFDDDWRTTRGYQSYQWLHHLPSVSSIFRRPDAEVYREEKVRDREEQMNAVIGGWVESTVRMLTSIFGLSAAVVAVVWVKLQSHIAGRTIM